MSVREQFLSDVYILLLKNALAGETSEDRADASGLQNSYKLSDDPSMLATQAKGHADALFGGQVGRRAK